MSSQSAESVTPSSSGPVAASMDLVSGANLSSGGPPATGVAALASMFVGTPTASPIIAPASPPAMGVVSPLPSPQIAPLNAEVDSLPAGGGSSPFSPNMQRRPSIAPPPLPSATHKLSHSGSSARSLPGEEPATPAAADSAAVEPATAADASEASAAEATPAAAAVAVVEEVTFIPEEVDPGKSDEERLRRYRFRTRVAQELLSTEQSYVASLHSLQSVYITPLCDEKSGLLTTQQSDTLFSNLSVLTAFQDKFLVDIQKTLDGWSPATQDIGPLFLLFGPYLKMYRAYVANYDYSTELLSKLTRSDSFGTFCRRLREATPGTLDLQSFLIMPIQRVPRYKLIISELLRYTNPAHSDYAPLSRAMEVISDVALHINEAVRKQQNTQTLLNLQDKFSGGTQLIGPNTNSVPGSRRLLKQGPLSKKGRRSDQLYEFLLFSDFLLYCRTTNFGGYKLHRKIFVNGEFAVSDVADGPDLSGQDGEDGVAVGASSSSDRFCIQILSAQKSFIVYARDAREKADWMTALQEAVSELRKAEATNLASTLQSPTPGGRRASISSPALGGLTSPAGSALNTAATASAAAAIAAAEPAEFGAQQPVFAQFKSSSVCSLCSTRCTFSSGRHHCRACGCIVCNSCARDRIYLAWTKQCSRTCDRCCQRLKDERSAKLEKLARLSSSASATATATTPAPPGAGAPRLPPRPQLPARPHQDQLFRLVNELLETSPRLETMPRDSLGSPTAHTRAMSVFSSSSSAAGSSTSGSSSVESDIAAALDLVRFQDGTVSERPKVVGQLPFVRARGLQRAASKRVRSHSVMVSGATAGGLASAAARAGDSDNDGLSESDDEGAWEPMSMSTASSNSSVNSEPPSARPRLSFSDAVDERDEEMDEVVIDETTRTRAATVASTPPPRPAPLSPASTASNVPSAVPSPSAAASATDATVISPPPVPGRPRLSGGSVSSSVLALQRMLGQMGSSPPPPGRVASRSVSIMTSDIHSPVSAAAPAGASPPAARPRPPALPARSTRSQSVMIPADRDRLEKRRSIMATLVDFFTSRPSKETLVAKNIMPAQSTPA